MKNSSPSLKRNKPFGQILLEGRHGKKRFRLKKISVLRNIVSYIHDINVQHFIYIIIYITYILLYLAIKHGFLSSVRDFDKYASISHFIIAKCYHKPEELQDMKPSCL